MRRFTDTLFAVAATVEKVSSARPNRKIPSSATRRRGAVSVSVVLVPALLAIGLGVFELSLRSLWIDESATFSIASQHGSALWAGIAHDGGNMLLYYLLEHVLMGAFGHGTLVMRLPSVIASGITAGAVAAIGMRLCSPRVGAAAGVLAAVSLPMVYWSQNARAYALMVAMVTTSYVAFIALVDGESSRRPGRPPAWAWPCYVLSLVIAAYASLLALLVVPAQLAALWWYRRRFSQVISALVVVALTGIPLLLLAHARGTGQLFWIPPPTLGSLWPVALELTSAGLSPNFALTATSGALFALTLAVLLAVGALALRRMPSTPGTSGISMVGFTGALVAGWLVVPFVLDLGESLVGQPVFESRYLLISMPAVALGLAFGLLSTGLPRVAGVSAVALFVVLRGAQVLPSYGVSPENWKAATSFVLSHDASGDCIAFYPSDGRMAFEYYLLSASPAARAAAPTPVLPSLPYSTVRPFVEDYRSLSRGDVSALSSRCRSLFLVASHVGQAHGGTAVSLEHVRRFDTLLAELRASFRSETSSSFGYAAVVHVYRFFG